MNLFEKDKGENRLSGRLIGMNPTYLLLGPHLVSFFDRDIVKVLVDRDVIPVLNQYGFLIAWKNLYGKNAAVKNNPGVRIFLGSVEHPVALNGDPFEGGVRLFAVPSDNDTSFNRRRQLSFVRDEILFQVCGVVRTAGLPPW